MMKCRSNVWSYGSTGVPHVETIFVCYDFSFSKAVHTLGDIIHMGPVVFLTEDQQKRDRYLVMFPETLVILSVSPRKSAFVYEGKLPLSGIIVRRLDSVEYPHAFEISGNMIQRFVVNCASSEILNQWLNFLQSYNVRSLSPASNTSSRSTLNRISPSHGLQTRSSHSPTNFLHSNDSHNKPI